jgi:hypothetical protein
MDDEGPRYWLWSLGGVGLGLLVGLLMALSGTPACSLNPSVRTASGDTSSMPPLPEKVEPSRLAQAQRGWYLATAAGCAACHTPVDPFTGPLDAQALSGGMALRSRFFGTLYSANITADLASGIGKLRDEHGRLRSALRGGAGTRDQVMHPAAMPWLEIGRADTEDLECILYYLLLAKAYSRTFPPRGAPGTADPAGVWMGLGSWSRTM